MSPLRGWWEHVEAHENLSPRRWAGPGQNLNTGHTRDTSHSPHVTPKHSHARPAPQHEERVDTRVCDPGEWTPRPLAGPWAHTRTSHVPGGARADSTELPAQNISITVGLPRLARSMGQLDFISCPLSASSSAPEAALTPALPSQAQAYLQALTEVLRVRGRCPIPCPAFPTAVA